jgi:hypothetical protein
MKLISKFAVMSLLALSTAPAFAGAGIDYTSPEAMTTAERSVAGRSAYVFTSEATSAFAQASGAIPYQYTSDARVYVRTSNPAPVISSRATRAFAQSPVASQTDRHDGKYSY